MLTKQVEGHYHDGWLCRRSRGRCGQDNGYHFRTNQTAMIDVERLGPWYSDHLKHVKPTARSKPATSCASSTERDCMWVIVIRRHLLQTTFRRADLRWTGQRLIATDIRAIAANPGYRRDDQPTVGARSATRTRKRTDKSLVMSVIQVT